MSDRESRDKPELENHSDDVQAGGVDEVGYAIADLIRDEGFCASVSQVVKAAAENKSKELRLSKHGLYASLVFSILVFAGIGLMGWLRIITSEATAGLLGALIGYWYGRQQAKN